MYKGGGRQGGKTLGEPPDSALRQRRGNFGALLILKFSATETS